MNAVMTLMIGIFEITMLNLILSADNIGVIALATKKLPEDIAKKASALGITGAVVLRIFFTCIITYIMMIEWLPIKLVGGILLIKITWDLIMSQDEEEEDSVKEASKLWSAVISIIIADVSMSLDNVLAIAAAAEGNMVLIIFGILLNIPILFFGSKLVVSLMKKYNIVVYIGGAILAHTSIKMIFEDRLLVNMLPHEIALISSWLVAALTIIYGFYKINKTHKSKNINTLGKSA